MGLSATGPEVFLIAGCGGPVAERPMVVLLVRHAEKVDASQDPDLSAAGETRAMRLVGLLRDAGLDHVHSSDFIRTRETAAPMAAELDLDVELYDPGDLAALARKIRATGGRHLMVGHSNTTPEMVDLLDGDPGSEMDESEYDRLYVVTIGVNGTASAVLLRYGDP